ncbi:hypothetical protein Scep_010124 [Stephania cephalantha]|uniref:Exportin-4 n=1 Tax=Stephania cephalantha TaxID=152367 RepID=A0AAP0JUF4_9MAGN
MSPHQRFHHGGQADLHQLQHIMRTIEQACISVQMHINPMEAEAVILSLRQSPLAYQACLFILENSQVTNAKFHAASAIQEVAVREWTFLTDDEKRSLIRYCLSYVFQHSCSTDGYVQRKVSAVGAQFLKRGWLDFTVGEKEAFFTEVKQAILGCHGADAQFIGVNFLDCVVSEFSPSTASAMGLPREFHEQCRASVESNYLKKFYCWAQDAALSVTNRLLEHDATVSEVKVCTAALNLMFQILNWDFKWNVNAVDGANSRINVFSSKVRPEIVLPNSFECVLVQPGPAWYNTLISSGHVTWLLGLYGTMRQKFSHVGSWIVSPLAVSARKLVVLFCSLTGTIFPSDDGQMQEHHLLQILSCIVQWICPPGTITAAINGGKSESEFLDGCRALLSMATLTTPQVFDKLLRSISPFGTLSLLSSLTCEVVQARATSDTTEETWSWIARDILLDTWIVLLEPKDPGKDTTLPPEGVASTASVFKLIVESELKAAAALAFEEEDDYFQASVSAMDERFNSYALIARRAVDRTIPFLTHLFSQRLSMLHQEKGKSDLTCILEELFSLLLFTGHVLADAGEGETPLVPEAFQSHFMDVLGAEQHPVIVLSCTIIKFAEQSLNPEMRSAFFSPRLMEALIWFLARWSNTYLMPHETARGSNCSQVVNNDRQQDIKFSRNVLIGFCGEHDQGKYVLDVILRISLMTLISYSGEKALQELTCYKLLPALVRRKNVCVHLFTLDSWNDLVNAFAKNRSLFDLVSPHQCSLTETLVRAASGIRNSEASNQYVRELMGQMVAYLLDLTSKADLRTIAQQPNSIQTVSCLLARLRGAARATQPRTQRALYEMGVSVLNAILTLLEVYKHESAVIYLVLKFVIDWVDGQLVFLEVEDTAVVVNFCLTLLQLYSKHNIGKISLSLSSTLLTEAKTEKYKDLRALLQLLTSLCSKDLVDFSSDSLDKESADIAQVIYLGLHIVTPLISLELLKYPKLCHDYFTLVSHILEVYPEKLVQLNTESFSHMLGTLDFGIHQQDVEVVNMCLGSLNGLASYHYKERVCGKEGLGSCASGFRDHNGQVIEGVLSRFLRSLLQLLLFRDYSFELISSAADALLPLILCEKDLYEKFGQELIEKQPTPELKLRLANALQALTGSNQVSSSLDRINYKRFRKNLQDFLIEVRGFLQIM